MNGHAAPRDASRPNSTNIPATRRSTSVATAGTSFDFVAAKKAPSMKYVSASPVTKDTPDPPIDNTELIAEKIPIQVSQPAPVARALTSTARALMSTAGPAGGAADAAGWP